jgi:hypothetical protein
MPATLATLAAPIRRASLKLVCVFINLAEKGELLIKVGTTRYVLNTRYSWKDNECFAFRVNIKEDLMLKEKLSKRMAILKKVY